MSWERIIGHDLAKGFLRKTIVGGRVSHAYAFTGPSGIGKATTARVFAKALLCPDVKDADPCDSCRVCRRIDRGVHPDVHWVAAESNLIRIDQIREMQAGLSLKPFEAQTKVAVIDGADDMTTAAQNCLLKVLEEPPGEAVVILVASNPSALLSTIRSRCQTVRCQPLATKDVVETLQDRGVPEDEARLLAAVSEGRLGVALQGAEQDIVALRNRVAMWVGDLGDRAYSLKAVLTIGQKVEEDKDNIDRYLSFFLLWLRDMILVQEGVEEAIANQDEIERLKEQSSRTHTRGLADALQAVDTARHKLRGNSNFRLTLDVMLSHLQRSLAA